MMKLLDADIVVVGAGIAGATIARLLGEAGHTVILLDRARFPREKPCGEGIMPTGVRLLDQWGLLQRIPPGARHPIRGVRFSIGDSARVQGDFPDIGDGYHVGIGVRRFVLDESLLRQAASHSNVLLREGERATDVRRINAVQLEVLSEHSAFRGRLVVGADGLHSLVARRLGFRMRHGRRQRFALRAHFQLSPDMRPEDYVSVRLSRGIQCFTTPVGGSEVQISLLFEKADMKLFPGQIGERFESMLTRFPDVCTLIGGAQRISPILACGPFDVWPRHRVADGSVLVGDAGGYLDPITGEGISLGLQAATWAAEVISEGLRHGDLTRRRLAAYDKRLSRATRQYRWLTRVVLAIARNERRAATTIAKLSHCPHLYQQLLGINCGVGSFFSVPLIEWSRFVLAPRGLRA